MPNAILEFAKNRAQTESNIKSKMIASRFGELIAQRQVAEQRDNEEKVAKMKLAHAKVTSGSPPQIIAGAKLFNETLGLGPSNFPDAKRATEYVKDLEGLLKVGTVDNKELAPGFDQLRRTYGDVFEQDIRKQERAKGLRTELPAESINVPLFGQKVPVPTSQAVTLAGYTEGGKGGLTVDAINKDFRADSGKRQEIIKSIAEAQRGADWFDVRDQYKAAGLTEPEIADKKESFDLGLQAAIKTLNAQLESLDSLMEGKATRSELYAKQLGEFKNNKTKQKDTVVSNLIDEVFPERAKNGN